MTMHDRTLTRSTYSTFNCLSPIDVAVAGAKVAIIQMPPRAGNTSRKFARFGEVKIAGLHDNQYYYVPVLRTPDLFHGIYGFNGPGDTVMIGQDDSLVPI
jgi:arginase family enzyme